MVALSMMSGEPSPDEARRVAAAASLPLSMGRARPVIEAIRPVVDAGRFPAKRTVGEEVVFEADICVDGHDQLLCAVRLRHEQDARWTTIAMVDVGNDHYVARCVVDREGTYRFAISSTIDEFGSWLTATRIKRDAAQPLGVELAVGAELLAAASSRARLADSQRLASAADALRLAADRDPASGAAALEAVTTDEVVALCRQYADPLPSMTSEQFVIAVERVRAGYGMWYELFPRSTSPDPNRAGTLRDVEGRLDYLERLGADVLYLPPLHPIGRTNRKGRNGVTVAAPTDPGSPWAIGSSDGGHLAIAPELGTLDDFDHLLDAARARGIEIALDLVFTCSPDHPWVSEHPEWFRRLPDGSIRYAENPPKRYEDVYPFDFDTAAWRELWEALYGIVDFWAARGVTIFRVDNPHTKPFRFWQWCLARAEANYPGTVFLAEAFTRPRPAEHLAKIGFSQSCTYFTWRTTKWELESYLTELTTDPVVEFLRPNFWVNTPDILPEHLQRGGRAASALRLLLASTLAATYGIYGPVFELAETTPRAAGSEEYLNSEKYEVRHFDLDAPGSLASMIARINQIRRGEAALRQNQTLRFHHVDNPELIAYSKTAPGSTVIVVVNLDPFHVQSGFVELDLEPLGIVSDGVFAVHDRLQGAHYTWRGRRNYVALDPAVAPGHVLCVEQTSPEGPDGRTSEGGPGR